VKKLSVIIPIYNVEQYVEKCIASVYQQNLSEDEFDVIVVDDESPDGSLAIVQGIAKHHTNIKIISQKNKGLGGARNTGVEATTTKYLLFLDSDDFLEPNVLPTYLDLAEKHRTDFVEFGVQAAFMDGTTKVIKSNTSNGNVYSGIDYASNFEYMYSSDNKLYATEFWHSNGLKFIEHIYIEDYEFMTRAFYKAQRIVASDLIGVNYLQSPGSITRSTDPVKKKKKMDDMIRILGIVSDAKAAAIAKGDPQETIRYYNIRLSFLNVTVLTQLLKDNASYSEMKAMRNDLKSKALWMIDEPVVELPRNLFRLALKHCFGLFSILLPIKRLF